MSDIAVLARGGRANVYGFLLRLLARLPFLFIAGRLYGAEPLGRFAYAIMVVELVAQVATLGLKRGIAAALASSDRPQAHVVGDALVLAVSLGLLGALALALVPQVVFPNTYVSGLDQLFPLIIVAIVGSDVTLAALAYRHDFAAQVRARSIVEPWVLTLAAAALALTHFKRDGLILAYVASLVAAFAVSAIPCMRSYGLPRGWRPYPARLFRLARENIPLAGADAIEWGSRRLDIFILGLYAGPRVVGVYYVAQQVASLAYKLKTSFDPVLAPVLSRGIRTGDRISVAAHVRQVMFWVTTAQLCVALALGLPGAPILRLFGHDFGAGALALALLLAAEVLAAPAAVSEAALIYAKRHRNLLLSLVAVLLQLALSLALAPAFGAVGVGASLALSMAAASLLKTRQLRRTLDAPVFGWRFALLPATAAALAVGLPIMLLPDWLEIGLGVLLIPATYAAVIWFKGFEGPDRLLFQRASSSPSEKRQ